jgi:hypothetical protein
MTFAGLAAQIALREGKRSQARVSDIREILGILTDMMAEEMVEMGSDVSSHELLIRRLAEKKIKKIEAKARSKKLGKNV